MMNNVLTPKAMRQLMILAGAMLLASLVISGVNAYVTLAAPVKSPYVSDKVGFEGQLADSSGNPVADGPYTVLFSLYDQASGGDLKWSETQTVTVTKGLYSVQLGTNNALPSNAFDGPRFLGVKVGSDSEMTPRISISAVPFALNAKQAMGLQGFNVSSNQPSSNNGLFWDSTNSAWTPRAATFPDLGPVGSNANPQSFLANYRSGAILTYKDANKVSVSAGQVMVDGYMRNNPDNIDVGFTVGGLNLGLDTGTAASNTKYYVYAIADEPSMSTFQLIISSGSTPFGKSHFRQLGWFWTSTGNTNIQPGTIGNRFENDSNVAQGARVYNNAQISAPAAGVDTALTFNSERFDTDDFHSITSNTSRLTASIAGKYVISGTVSMVASCNGGSSILFIRLNGSTKLAVASGGYCGPFFVETVYTLGIGDYVELVINNAAAGHPIDASPNYSPEFTMVRMGD